MSDPFNPGAGTGAPFVAGPSFGELLSVLSELVTATNAQAQVIQGSLGQAASGDLVGAYPGPIQVVSTHLTAPLPLLQGGLGLTGGNSGGLLYFPTPGTLASTNPFTANALLLGGGAGAAPASLGSLGSATTVLHGNPGGPPVFGPVVTGDISDGAITYGKLQNESAATFLGNPTAVDAPPSEISLGATLAFVGTALRTRQITGDVTALANSFATTVGRIAGIDVDVAAWTPALEFGGASTGVTYAVQNGSVIRLGKLVIAFFAFTLTSKGSATGDATIEGLPVASGALAGVGMIGSHAAMAAGNIFEINVPTTGTAIGLGQGNAAASTPLDDTDFTNTSALAGVALYLTA